MSKTTIQTAVAAHLFAKQEVVRTREGLEKLLMACSWRKFTYASEDVSSLSERWEGVLWFHPSLREQLDTFVPWQFQHGRGGAYGEFARFRDWISSLSPELYVDLS